jgi:uncharacterized membrane protein
MKMMRMVCGLCLILVSLLVVFPTAAVLAQEETPPPDKLSMKATYSKLEGIAGTSFQFGIDLMYEGAEARVFDLVAIGPKDWTTYITPSYPEDKQILDVRLEPMTSYAQTIKVNTSPPYWMMPEPGEYQITVEATSGEVKSTLNLTAIVTASYMMSLVPTEELYNTKATAGKDNYFSLEVLNNGSAAIDNITFSPSKPSGWTIEFTPDEIDTLGALSSQTVGVNIKPPAKTISGDYEISIKANGKQASDDIDIRVTVETPTIWGWVGVGIIVLVVAGVAFIFMRFSRR